MDLAHESRLTAVEERSKSNTHRIDKLEESTEAINRIATSVEVIAERQVQMADSVGELEEKVTAIEQRPTKRWDSMVDKAIGAAVGVVITYLLAQAGIF